MQQWCAYTPNSVMVFSPTFLPGGHNPPTKCLGSANQKLPNYPHLFGLSSKRLDFLRMVIIRPLRLLKLRQLDFFFCLCFVVFMF